MTTLTHRRTSRHVLNRLIDEAPSEPATISDDQRRSLASRFRAVPCPDHRRLDAWMVERAAQPGDAFRWSPATTRRVLGNAALRRTLTDTTLTCFQAVEIEVSEYLLRAAEGYASPGSLGSFLAHSSTAVRGLVAAEAANWATELGEAAASFEHQWSVTACDAYYDVAGARTTLRGRRDLVVARENSRVLVRMRAGAPGKSAGPGLRVDLTIDALARPDGVAASRVIGLWPAAGVVLCVDGTMADLRSGARDVVRTAVALSRQRLAHAA